MASVSRRLESCLWCGREVADSEVGRRRRYCRQSCRQRAYEQRSQVRRADLAPDSVILTAEEARALADRAFEVRAAAEDIATAVDENASRDELAALCAELVQRARDAERLR
ncbi:MAG: hypothetical protein GX542_02825 [Rhodococcus sp.]|nr:hypothetical protein [Rhodococcus sp. (in: high G+C Gram-positive bacteria)]